MENEEEVKALDDACKDPTQRLGFLNAKTKNAIELDLRRTYPDNPMLSTEDCRAAMRQVLQALALQNPVLGYCQGLNYICGRMLLFSDPESVFWMMDCLIVAGYYNYRPADRKWEKWELGTEGYYISGMRLLRSDSESLRCLADKFGIMRKDGLPMELDVAFFAPW